MAKPYSTSHIGFVSSGFTDMRLSGAVKEQLVEMLVAEIDQMVPAMEAATPVSYTHLTLPTTHCV